MRVADNESAFRSVNERVEELGDQLGLDPEFVCECARMECAQRLRVPIAEYERVRASGTRFIVAEGHEQPEFERVIEQGPGWLVVEKSGEAGAEADEQDPRGGGRNL